MSRRSHEAGPVVSLPITPMLDMSFQLLFFFMATFNPTDREGAQILAIAQDKKAETRQETSPLAAKPENVDPNQIPGEKPKQPWKNPSPTRSWCCTSRRRIERASAPGL